jgi:hypothetical protein
MVVMVVHKLMQMQQFVSALTTKGNSI